MSDDVWEGDKLGRQADAEFLIEYLILQNERAKERGERGTAITLNADWGAGKSFFISRVAKHLRSQGYRVAMVDAWRDDHADDPIFAVMAAVFLALGKSEKKTKLKTALKNSAGKIAIKSAKGLASRAAALVIGSNAVEGIADDIERAIAGIADETASEFADRAIKQFEDGQQAIDDFREELKNAISKEKPLFLFVDELDRCRPTYAIALLERIKHLFDVPNVVFIVATNVSQLSHTVRAVYGNGFDAERYLFRFFDRVYTFEEPNLADFVDFQWKQFGLDKFKFMKLQEGDNIQDAASICRIMKLSLRDITQCFDILSSVANSSNDSVPIPLLFALPLVASYHLHYADAFEMASRPITSPPEHQRRAFSAAFPSDPIRIYPAFQDYSRAVGEKSVSIIEIMQAFTTIIREGLVDQLNTDTVAQRYAENYRASEFGLLHRNEYRIGVPAISVLNQYNSIIKRVGRFAIPKENPK